MTGKHTPMIDPLDEMDFTLPDDVEDALRRQEDALTLLERLRTSEPSRKRAAEGEGRGRRDFRRWPMPDGVTLELHDGGCWRAVEATDMGIGGARLSQLPAWMLGPAPARLKAVSGPPALVLADVMWQDKKSGAAGLRFEFLDTEERDGWADSLLDALLARYSVG